MAGRAPRPAHAALGASVLASALAHLGPLLTRARAHPPLADRTNQTLLRSLLEIYAPSSPIRPTTLALLPALLSAAQATPSPTELPLDSPARAAFDPAVSRQLTAHVPLSTVDLGLSWQADAWARMAALVDGLEEVGEAIWDDGMGGGWRNVVGWLDYLHLAGVTPARPQPSAFIRSLLLVRPLPPHPAALPLTPWRLTTLALRSAAL